MLRMDMDDHAAIQAVLAGDKEAYAVLVVRHSRRLYRVAFRITGNQADAEDVVQEALLRGYRKLESFESRSDFGTWMYRIAVRCALDRISGSKVNESSRITETTDREHDGVQIADREAGPERLLLSGEIRAMQQIAMHGLSPTERTAFMLRHLEDRTTEEIAIAMGIPPSAAKQSVFRTLQKLTSSSPASARRSSCQWVRRGPWMLVMQMPSLPVFRQRFVTGCKRILLRARQG
jgi:RNA polymerase sigma-70 factor, ECF subfamily